MKVDEPTHMFTAASFVCLYSTLIDVPLLEWLNLYCFHFA